MPVSPARSAAFTILLRVERESAFASELLHSSLLDDLSPPDRNLCTEIVMGVLRWRSAIDRTIAQLSFTPFRKLDLEVLTALRMGAYEKAQLSRIPNRATVNETVELVKLAKKTSAAGLVNAVMRKLKLSLDAARAGQAGAEYLEKALAHPHWLVERWIENFGVERAELICKYDQHVPDTVLRLSADDDGGELQSEGVKLAPGALLKNARRVIAGDVAATTLYQAGRIAIQDEGSQLVAALVGKGKRVLDCCAAPGGKTGAIAGRLPEAQVLAVELHPHRARLLRRMVPQTNVEVMTADALQLPFAAEFDRVLADVPCSGTGTLARNPEIKWRLKPDDLKDLQQRQTAILNAAMAHVAPGGRLVYSTCSLEPEENEWVVEACLRSRKEFRILPAREELQRLERAGELVWADVDALLSGDFLRTIPGIEPCDGFFAAVMEKT